MIYAVLINGHWGVLPRAKTRANTKAQYQDTIPEPTLEPTLETIVDRAGGAWEVVLKTCCILLALLVRRSHLKQSERARTPQGGTKTPTL